MNALAIPITPPCASIARIRKCTQIPARMIARDRISPHF
jgi:hypothetical protein